MKNFLEKIPAPENKVFWLSSALLLKFAYFTFFINFFSPQVHPGDISGFWGVTTNDSLSYLQPVEKCLESGSISYLFGERMFGYSLPYLMLRILFAPATALNTLILLQAVVSAAAVYLLALTAREVTKSPRAFHFAFWGHFFLAIACFYDIAAMTESLASSSLIISFHYLHREHTKANLIISGLFLTWTCFLRAVFFPIFALHLLVIAKRNWAKKYTAAASAVAIFCFLLPLALAEGTWILGRLSSGASRNIILPPSTSAVYDDDTKHTMAMIGFLKALGEVWWHSHDNSFYNSPEVPSHVKTSLFGPRELADLRSAIKNTQSDLITLRPDRPTQELKRENQEISRTLRAYTQAIKRERPKHYYLKVPAKYLWILLSTSSTHRMFGNYSSMNPKLKLFRLGTDMVIWTIEATLILCLLWLPNWRRIETSRLHAVAIVLYTAVIHAVIFRHPDFRYIVPTLPLALAIIVITLERGQDATSK